MEAQNENNENGKNGNMENNKRINNNITTKMKNKHQLNTIMISHNLLIMISDNLLPVVITMKTKL